MRNCAKVFIKLIFVFSVVLNLSLWSSFTNLLLGSDNVYVEFFYFLNWIFIICFEIRHWQSIVLLLYWHLCQIHSPICVTLLIPINFCSCKFCTFSEWGSDSSSFNKPWCNAAQRHVENSRTLLTGKTFLLHSTIALSLSTYTYRKNPELNVARSRPLSGGCWKSFLEMWELPSWKRNRWNRLGEHQRSTYTAFHHKIHIVMYRIFLNWSV